MSCWQTGNAFDTGNSLFRGLLSELGVNRIRRFVLGVRLYSISAFAAMAAALISLLASWRLDSVGAVSHSLLGALPALGAFAVVALSAHLYAGASGLRVHKNTAVRPAAAVLPRQASVARPAGFIAPGSIAQCGQAGPLPRCPRAGAERLPTANPPRTAKIEDWWHCPASATGRLRHQCSPLPRIPRCSPVRIRDRPSSRGDPHLFRMWHQRRIPNPRPLSERQLLGYGGRGRTRMSLKSVRTRASAASRAGIRAGTPQIRTSGSGGPL